MIRLRLERSDSRRLRRSSGCCRRYPSDHCSAEKKGKLHERDSPLSFLAFRFPLELPQVLLRLTFPPSFPASVLFLSRLRSILLSLPLLANSAPFNLCSCSFSTARVPPRFGDGTAVEGAVDIGVDELGSTPFFFCRSASTGGSNPIMK